MLSILFLYYKREVRKELKMRYDTFRQEVKLYFTLFYESRIKGFVFKTYFDERIFKNFKDKRSNFLGLLKILFFFHVFIFFVDIIFALFYFIEFLINIFFRYIFFSIGQFFYMISCLLKFLAYEKRKYIDYEKLEKTINIILRIKKKYKKKNKYYIMLSDYIDPNEKKIKSFLRKKKLDIKTNNFSTFFLDLANTFHTDIQAYMLETIIVRRKSNKRWRSYLYLFFISTFFYSFRLFVASMKNLYQKNFYYEAIFEFLKQSVPTKLKKNFWYYFHKIRLKILKIGNIFFQFIYRCIFYVYVYFLSKIRKFFMKIYIPFKQIHSLKKALKKRITYYAEHKYKINENLCKKYNLDYNKVVEDKHKLYKYTTKFDFYLHRINSKPNLYFTYLKYILMDKLVGNIHFKFSYIKIINLTFSRYFMLFRKLVWPHIYVISSFLADKFCKYYNFIISHCLFVIGCLFFVPKFIYDAMRVRLEKIIKIFRTLYWLFITRNKK